MSGFDNPFKAGKNYQRLGTRDVFTAAQANALYSVAKNPMMQAIILLDFMPTDEPATNPCSEYGPVDGRR